MISKSGFFIAALSISIFSQTIGLNTSTIVDRYSLLPASLENSPVLLDEFKSARNIATTGAILVGGGLVMSVIGTVVLLDDAISHASSSEEMNSLPKGTGTMLTGVLVTFAGQITACAGGGKARNLLRTTGEVVPPFYGWGMFWGSLGVSLLSSFIPSDIQALKSVLSIVNLGLSVGSIVHSVSYASRAYNSQLKTTEAGAFVISPIVMVTKDKSAYGLSLSAGF
ncbi:MAG: hypothetical protein JW915_17845 [Chitinispirillaceae bacterium]|nr:hypothetical protein [Chitinispirillaceae bacterium]